MQSIESIPISLGFEDVAISQKKNLLKSRLDANIESEIIRGVFRPIPLIAANMNSVINPDFYIKLYNLGAFAVLHRACDYEQQLADIKKVASRCEWVASSVGISESDFESLATFVHFGMNVCFIDVAHGYSDFILDYAKKIKREYPGLKLVLGNTTNVGLLEESSEFADAIKVGIAQGFACETANTAGCTEKQFSAVLKFKERSRQLGVPIISDGGIREAGDFSKSIAAGANSAMAGKIFAMCPESAAEVVMQDGMLKKRYVGMAARATQNEWKGGLKAGTCSEGGVRFINIGESSEALLERYSGALRSSITYGGGIDIKSFQDSVEFVRFK